MLIEVANKRFIETKYVSQVYVHAYTESRSPRIIRIYIYANITDPESGSVLLEDLGRDVDKATVDKKLQEWVNKINAANNGKTYFSDDELRELMADDVNDTGD